MIDDIAKYGDMVRSKKYPDRCAMVQEVGNSVNGPVYHTALGWWLAHEVTIERRAQPQGDDRG